MSAPRSPRPPRRYPPCPLLAASAVVVEGGRVLLIRRGRPPGQGLYSVPGGLVELGEGTREAAAREVREETGLEVEPVEVLAVVDRIARDAQGRVETNYVIVDWLALRPRGTPRPGDDADEVRWATLEEAAALPLTEGLMPVLERAVARARALGPS